MWPIANFIWLYGEPVALFIDWQTGAWYDIKPKTINVILRKKEIKE